MHRTRRVFCTNFREITHYIQMFIYLDNRFCTLFSVCRTLILLLSLQEAAIGQLPI
jgi:hypothetical protein